MSISPPPSFPPVLATPRPDLEELELPSETMPLNMGPSHPAMHGTVRMVLEVEGEKISSADIQIGYLHRCFE